jgi:hypothetical protein
MNNQFPKCPCGSEKPYEECCYLIVNSAGNHKYHNGASSFSNGQWHPLPLVRFAAILGVKENDRIEERSRTLLQNVKLDSQKKEKIIIELTIFEKSFLDLIGELQSKTAKNISVITESIEIRKLWRNYLINGRELLNKTGYYSNVVLKLKNELGGLNKKSIKHLIDQLTDDKPKNFLKKNEKLLIDFITIRDIEKSNHSTVSEFPIVSPEGKIIGGKIGGRKENISINYEFSDFLVNSHNLIIETSKLLLGINK